jgi:hypothetical protein
MVANFGSMAVGSAHKISTIAMRSARDERPRAERFLGVRFDDQLMARAHASRTGSEALPQSRPGIQRFTRDL